MVIRTRGVWCWWVVSLLAGAACSSKTSQETPPPLPSATASAPVSAVPVVSSAPPLPTVVVVSPLERSEELLRRYLGTADCKERLQYILHPDTNQQPLLAHHADLKTCKKTPKTLDASDCARPLDQRCTVKATFETRAGFFRTTRESAQFCVEFTPEPRLDWRCSVGFNPQPLKVFRSIHDLDRPARFRMHALLSDDYREAFASAKATAWSVKLTDVNGESIQGYAPKDSEPGKALFAVLQDGKPHDIVVELTYQKPSPSPAVATITGLPGSSWREYPGE